MEHILSEPSESWSGRKGRISESILEDFIMRTEGSKYYVCVCGPTAFTDQAIGCVTTFLHFITQVILTTKPPLPPKII